MNLISDGLYLETILLSFISGAFILFLFTTLLYFIQKNQYMKYWSLFWISTTFMFISLYLSVHQNSIFFFGLYLWLVLLAGYFLYNGCYLFIEKQISKKLNIVQLVFAILILPTVIFPDWIGWGVTFAFIGYGLYLLSIGKTYHKHPQKTMAYLGILMIIFSFFSFIYPFILASTWFLNYGYIILGMFGLLMGISLFLVHFQQERQAFLSVQSKLEYLIMHDPLTDLYNRAYMSEQFNNLMENNETSVGLLFIDLNDFKLVNDQYGHRAGDESLVHIALELKELITANGKICRFGGDEFVVIMKNTSIDEVKNMQQLILHFIPQLPYDVEVSLAVGMSYKENKDQDIYELLDQAEREMYSFKQQQKS